jgi:hypothetical protein
MNAAAFITAVELTYAESHSAQPNAPVVPERESRLGLPVHSARHTAARILRRAANRVEPAKYTCA